MRSQQQFDWNRSAQLRAIERLRLPDGLVDQYGRGVSAAACMLVLSKLDSFAGLKGKAWPSLETLRARTGFKSVRTVRRALFALEQLGLISCWEERTELGHRRVGWLIHWEIIFRDEPLGIASSAEHETPASGPASRQTTVGRTAVASSTVQGARRVASSSLVASHSRPASSVDPPPILPETQVTLKTNPSDTGSKPSDTVSLPSDTGSFPLYRTDQEALKEPSIESSSSSSSTWREAEEELSRCGIQAFGEAVQTARRNGVTPRHVLELIAWWRQSCGHWAPQHRPGVLYSRIGKAREWLAVEDGWRAPDPGRERRVTASPAALAHRPREPDPPPIDFEGLYGAQVDRLSDNEFRELVAALSPYVAARYRQKGRSDKVVRSAVRYQLHLQSERVPQPQE